MQNTISKMLYKLTSKWLILLFFLPAIVFYFMPGSIIIPTALSGYLLIYYLYSTKWEWYNDDFDGKKTINLFFLLNLYIYLRGFFNITSQYDLYAMFSTLLFTSFLIPSLIYMGQPKLLMYIWRSFWVIGIPLSAFTWFFPPSDGIMSMGFNSTFLDVFILCIPFISKKKSIIILILSLLVILSDLDERSIIINLIIPLLIVIGWRFIKSMFTRKIMFYSIIILPIVLVALGVLGKFNIFEAAAENEFQFQGADRTMLVDSRTGIFTDVFMGIYNQDAVVWGLGGNGKVYSYLMDNTDYDFDTFYKNGRGATESGMLNYIMYAGLIGLIVYGLFLLKAGYLALFNSNNRFMQMLGLYVTFKFLFSFVDDRIAFNCHTLYFFIWVGICYNRSFRKMTDIEIKEYLNTIFK